MAETFVNLVTGATLPDRGDVRVFGRPTTAIDDSADWLAVVDRFGIVSERAVLLDALSVIQNLAIPFTLDIDPPPEDVRERASLLAREAGLREADWLRPWQSSMPAAAIRIRLARALALDPDVLLLEHANAGLPRGRGRGARRRHSADRVAARMRARRSDGGRRVCRGRGGPGADARPASGRLVRTTPKMVLIQAAAGSK